MRDWSSDVCSSDLAHHPNWTDAAALTAWKGFERDMDTLRALHVSFTEIDGMNIQNVIRDMIKYRSEERRVGKECRSRWSPYH